MDWANEKYVRLFVRDTATWKMLPWQSRALLPLVLRKLDRSGVMDVGDDGVEAIAAVVEVPVEFVQAGLPDLLRRKVFSFGQGRLAMPNYIPAQETRQSDAQRKRDSRERRATGGDISGREEDKQSPKVTGSHQLSPEVTLTPDLPHADPQTELESDARTRVERLTPPNEPGKPSPRLVVTKYLAIRAEVVVGSVAGANGLSTNASSADVEKAAAWISTMSPEECADIEPAIRLACQHVRNGDAGWARPEMAKAGFLFGCIVRSWPDLREELHGCAPKIAKTGEKPREQIRFSE